MEEQYFHFTKLILISTFYIRCKPSGHPRVSNKILFTQRNSKTRCGFYTYRNITQNKKVAFFNSHNFFKIKIWYRWVIMILPHITFNVTAQLARQSNKMIHGKTKINCHFLLKPINCHLIFTRRSLIQELVLFKNKNGNELHF